jgi:hypothetical protein
MVPTLNYITKLLEKTLRRRSFSYWCPHCVFGHFHILLLIKNSKEEKFHLESYTKTLCQSLFQHQSPQRKFLNIITYVSAIFLYILSLHIMVFLSQHVPTPYPLLPSTYVVVTVVPFSKVQSNREGGTTSKWMDEWSYKVPNNYLMGKLGGGGNKQQFATSTPFSTWGSHYSTTWYTLPTIIIIYKGAFTLNVKSVLSENLGGTQC